MKQNYIAAAACVLSLVACSKTELEEGVSAPKGEAVTLTVPQTKVALAGNYLDFEGDETIYAVATNGSTAELRNSSSTRGTFTGVFSEPVVDGSTISLYYNQASVDSDGTASYAQNGKPWLQALRKTFGRTGDGQISLTATLTAPAGVTAVAVATDGTGIETLEFHSKNGTAISSFDGKTFSGDPYVSQSVLVNKTSETKNCNIIYVPDGMEGGYWIKAVKDGQAMYKSYSSDKAVTQDSKVTIKEFVPASVKLDVQLSGFLTSYSYYVANEEGSDVKTKDVAKANVTANDYIGEGTATYTITREGIPSTLLKFESFKLTVDGKELTGTEADKVITYDASNGHTTWGQKDIVATVTYTNLATGATETASKTLTRHITGLPYSANFSSQPSEWSRGRNTSWSDGLKLGGGSSGDASATLSSLYIPSNIDVELKLGNIVMASIKGGTIVNRSKLNVTIGSNIVNKVYEGPDIGGWVWGTKTETTSYSSYSQSGTISSQNKNIKLQQQQEQAGCYCTIGSILLNYR